MREEMGPSANDNVIELYDNRVEWKKIWIFFHFKLVTYIDRPEILFSFALSSYSFSTDNSRRLYIFFAFLFNHFYQDSEITDVYIVEELLKCFLKENSLYSITINQPHKADHKQLKKEMTFNWCMSHCVYFYSSLSVNGRELWSQTVHLLSPMVLSSNYIRLEKNTKNGGKTIYSNEMQWNWRFSRIFFSFESTAILHSKHV